MLAVPQWSDGNVIERITGALEGLKQLCKLLLGELSESTSAAKALSRSAKWFVRGLGAVLVKAAPGVAGHKHFIHLLPVQPDIMCCAHVFCFSNA